MFGYVVANAAELSEDQKITYRGYYCGLCKSIQEMYGSMHRIALNYDMTFMVLLHNSLYDLDQKSSNTRCIVHPLKPHLFYQSSATQYAAAMNIALVYYKCLDNWNDEKQLHSFAISKYLSKCMPEITSAYPRQCVHIKRCMDELNKIEAANSQNPDDGTNIFGDLLGQVFIWKEDRWSDTLYQFGSALGRFIYLVDAVLDLPKDIKKGSYNPMRSHWSSDYDKQSYLPVLNMLLGECTDAFERLPLIENIELMRNILYSGIWTQFNKSH